jgi:nucleoporin p58/p45
MNSSGLNTSTNQQTQPAQQQSGGLFASLNQSSQPTANNAFGSTLGGGLKLGQAQQGQQVPGVRIDVSQMKGTTRFNDLHEDLQKQIEMIDKIILAQQSRAADCDAILPTHSQQLSSIPVDVDFLSKKVIGVESSLESDAEAVALVGQLVRTDAEHAKLSFKAIDNLKLPPQYHSQGNWMGKSGATPQGQSSSEPQDLVSYFSRTADEMSSTLSKYQSYIGEIEQHLRTVEATTIQQAQQLNGHGMSDDVDNQKRELASVLREFEAGIRGVAGEVAAAREGVQKLQLGGYIESSGDRRKNHNGKRVGIY